MRALVAVGPGRKNGPTLQHNTQQLRIILDGVLAKRTQFPSPLAAAPGERVGAQLGHPLGNDGVHAPTLDPTGLADACVALMQRPKVGDDHRMSTATSNMRPRATRTGLSWANGGV